MNKNGTESMLVAGMFFCLLGFVGLVVMAIHGGNPIVLHPLFFVFNLALTFSGLFMSMFVTAIKPEEET